MVPLRCPICSSQIDVETSKAMPFCSRRCQQLDLRRWLDESYGLPHEGDDPNDELLESTN